MRIGQMRIEIVAQHRQRPSFLNDYSLRRSLA